MVRLVSVKLTLAVLLAEVIVHFHASTRRIIHVDPQTVSQMSTPEKKPERTDVRKRHRLAAWNTLNEIAIGDGNALLSIRVNES